MPFFVVERSSVDSSLSIPLPDAYPTREAAIAALSAASAAGLVALTGEVFIADLDSAIPVLVMQPVAAPVSAPVEEVDIAQPTEELPGPGELEPEPEPEPEIEFEPADLAASDEVAIEEPVAEPEPAPELEAIPEAETAPEAEAVPETALDTESVEADDASTHEQPDAGAVPDSEAVDPGLLDEAAADDAYTSWEPVSTAGESTPSLADALKRATTTLEDEGIIAPDSIESAPAEDLAEDTSDVAALLASLSGEDAPGSDASVPAGEPAPAESGEWPWTNVESYEIPGASKVEAEDQAAPTDEIAVDLAFENAPIITSAPPAGEDAYLPRPVILGDYPDAPVIGAEDLIAVDDIDEVLPVEESAMAVDHADLSSETVVAAYEVTGELDLGEYTCQDCVYSNTCPKVGESSPADCGSFQWRSE